MKRVVKRDGIGNITIEEVPLPEISGQQLLVRNVRTLISRGSEIGRRYLDPGAVDPAIMGYSAAGIVEAVGADISEYVVGQRVAAVAPHAEYVVGDLTRGDGSWVTPMPDGVTFDQATFHGLATGALMWARIAGVTEGDTVVVLGAGLVGLLVLQAVRAYRPGRVIAVDALAPRCTLAATIGTDIVVNAADEDPVARVHALTDGQGAEVVIDSVGGTAGARSFTQAQAICRLGGTIHLIALYHGGPLALDAAKMQGRRLLGGYYTDEPRRPFAARAMMAIARGELQVDPLISHHFPATEAKAAFDLLYQRPEAAMGVLFDWE